ncbi:hypothetical protein [Kitasatospora sp. LaBMicrA B282]|uniref:hypothetical protein n=1 Tax=Kitasatospora sp. LaBMicrA B282 TaxID=3420949 RepID=UPI003D13F794
MATPTVDTTTRDPRSYVSPEVWSRQITLLMRDYPFDEVMANRLFHAAVSYLVTAMEKWGQGLEMCCGPIVDIAVHVFILDTKNYREFCAQHFEGRFLEHIPEIAFKYDGQVRAVPPRGQLPLTHTANDRSQGR